jgi:hypothetical protein
LDDSSSDESFNQTIKIDRTNQISPVRTIVVKSKKVKSPLKPIGFLNDANYCFMITCL